MTGNEKPSSRDVLGPLRPPAENLVYVDGLTGLFNQRLLGELFDEKFAELVSLAGSFALVMIDLDLFKEVNDRYGHLSGDDVLRTTGEILRDSFRESDLIFRYGGDEYLVLLPGATASEAEALGRRAREAMHRHEFFDREEKMRIDVPLSFSIGVAAYPGDGETGRAVLASADERLYAEKRIHLAARRRKSALAKGLVVLVPVAIFAAGVLVFVDKGMEEPPVPTVLVEPAAAVPDAVEDEERDLLLLEIEELQRQIKDLRAARPKVSSTSDRDVEIAGLEQKVAELTDQLQQKSEAEAAEKPKVAPEPVRAQPEKPPVEPVRKPPPPVQGETDRPAPIRAIVVPPRLTTPVTPKYPPFAKERGVEATINIEVLVDASGRVTEARAVGKPIGFGFEEAARQAALESEWSPATRNGVPILMRTTLQVRFQINR